MHVSDKQTLIKFMVSSQANKIINKLEYAPLANSIHTAVLNALAGNGGSQPACLRNLRSNDVTRRSDAARVPLSHHMERP